MRKYWFVCGLWLAVGLLVRANPGLAAEDPQNSDLVKELTAVREEYALPAVAAAVIVDGELRAVAAVGVRKHGSDVAVEVNDPFHLGSCTKAMTASLVGLLVQQGKLKWETTLAEYFPQWNDTMQPDYRNVTLVHLLSHRAGVPPMTNGFAPVSDTELLPLIAKPPPVQRRRVAEIVLGQPPVCKPGEKKLYSNAGFTIAGAIVEQVTGEDYETLLRRLLFEPLGMSTAGFGAMGSANQIDSPWQHRRSGDKIIPINPGPLSDNPPFITPAGRVHCSMADWAKYVRCILAATRGEKGLLDPLQIRQLQEPPFGGDYALGWGLHERSWGGGQVLSHAGSNGTNYCVAWVAPLRNFAVLAATNCGGEEAPKALDRICAATIKKFQPRD
jgi:CubicO group peptidase (beta-lactamase class C family)